ncbi:MAG: 1-phosphofructokinase family hexose kinase [Aquabacterium sp.]|uniref:1-phosphofructokinase family hexose kinase n=1 Tax=Aquabacterium sp. TaxID=1872578 RepID=UPI003BC4D1FC
MSQILTLTMNPALDISTSIDRVRPVHKLRCGEAQWHPGGGGINVARVLHRLGADVRAIYPAGGAIGQTLSRLLAEEGVSAEVVPIAGDTRESFSAHETASGQDFRFVLPGPTLSEAEWQQCLDAVTARVTAGGWVVLSGGLPPGVPADFYAQVAHHVRRVGGCLVLDSNGAALAQTLAQGVYLVKPSLRELSELTGAPLPDESAQVAAARAVIDAGQAQIVAVSLGEEGAMLITADYALRAPALTVKVASTIGAGDSFVGGLVWALSQGHPVAEAFRYAMATSAAALLSSGTALCDPGDVARLHEQVQIRMI